MSKNTTEIKINVRGERASVKVGNVFVFVGLDEMKQLGSDACKAVDEIKQNIRDTESINPPGAA